MITEEHVSYELAKLLKEKGFDEPIQYFYKFGSKELYRGTVFTNTQIGDKFYNAPTHQMAIKWLREEHKICIVIEPVVSDDDGDAGYLWSFRISRYVTYCSPSIFETYAEATEEAIKYSLENLI